MLQTYCIFWHFTARDLILGSCMFSKCISIDARGKSIVLYHFRRVMRSALSIKSTASSVCLIGKKPCLFVHVGEEECAKDSGHRAAEAFCPVPQATEAVPEEAQPEGWCHTFVQQSFCPGWRRPVVQGRWRGIWPWLLRPSGRHVDNEKWTQE